MNIPNDSSHPVIGTLNESAIHAQLKAWAAEPGDQFEVPVDGHVVDILRGPQVVEIQTGNFSGMKRKLNTLLKHHEVQVIHPIPETRWLIKTSQDQQETRRKSPKHGSLLDIFHELVSIPQLILHHRLSIRVVLTEEEEELRFAGEKRWRRKGWSRVQRRLLQVLEDHPFETPADWMALLPPQMETFTTGDLRACYDIPQRLAGEMAYTFHKAGLTQRAGKQGRFHLYAPNP